MCHLQFCSSIFNILVKTLCWDPKILTNFQILMNSHIFFLIPGTWVFTFIRLATNL